MVSQRGHKRKPHPTPDGNSGTQFSEDYGLRTTWGRHKTPVKGVGNKWRFQQFVLMWGGGTIILVSQKNDPSMGKLRRGLVTDIG